MEYGEYNPWDDRTTPDEFICAIIQDVCYNQNCDLCDDFLKFKEYYDNKYMEGR